jgi:hypothetical protein
MDGTPSLIHFDVPHGDAEQQAALMQRLGHPVTVCHGPAEDLICPILEKDGSCALIESAHGVVFEFDLDRRQHREILDKYFEVMDDDIPVRVIATPEVADRHAEFLRGVDVWTHEPTAGELDAFAALVEAADRAREAEQMSGTSPI